MRLLFLLALFIAPLGAQTYNARTDLNAAPETIPNLCTPVTQNIGCQMTSSDLNANVTYVRITNANLLGPNFAPRSFGPANSIDNAWSSDETTVVVVNLNGSLVPIKFNSASLTSSSITCTNTGDVNCADIGSGRVININSTDASYSRVTPNLLYTDNATGLLSIDLRPVLANPASATVTTQVVTTSTCPNIGSVGTKTGLVSISGNDSKISYPAGGGQNAFFLVIVYDPVQGCRWLNTSTGQVGGAWGTAGSVVYHDENSNVISWTPYSDAHGSQVDPTGRWVLVDSESTNNHFQDMWDVATNNIYQCGITSPSSGSCVGHSVFGYQNNLYFVVNDSQALINKHTFPPSLPFTRLYLNNTPPLPSGFGNFLYDTHTNWNNNKGADAEIMLIAPMCGTVLPCPAPTVAWDDELIGVYANGSSSVYRFAHAYSRDSNFFADILPQMSPSGKYALFGSDWGGTSQTDAFIVPLPLNSTNPTIGGTSFSGGTLAGSTVFQ